MSAFAFACFANWAGGSYRRSSSRIVSIAGAWVASDAIGPPCSRQSRHAAVLGRSPRPGVTRFGPKNGAPTGTITRPASELAINAADVYQPTPAVTIPAQPPAL